MPFADRRLVDVAGEDELGARIDEAREYTTAVANGALSRAPGCSEQVVVQDDDFKRARSGLGQASGSVLEVGTMDSSGLVKPGADGVEADEVQPL
jgi:hypothetical protein